METMIINQQSKVPYNRQLQDIIVKVANATAKLCKLTGKIEVSILIVDNSYIQELNLIYRQKNQPTDVLSFAMNELGEEEPDLDFSGDVNILGDIVVSLEQALAQSLEYGHELERELGYLIVHGMLHLLGYDHESEQEKELMRSLEEKVMQSVKLER
ncbi:MAG TPA: rRNA maturation RNase YbeY [Syntrophomonadaceae bacterium]|nr:rRNA maturation RNase YbeY [Syntrophomonadaceae bacterium]